MATATKDPVLAKPPGDCCLKGSIHEGEPQGTFEDITDVRTYIARPTADKANGNIIFYFPDVWGHFTNGFLIMDGFAAAGYLVLALDYFRGVGILFITQSIRRETD
jgi:dienelactone hydrolase